MGSYDIIVKTEEIKRRVQEKDYDSAQKILDTMALKKVRNIADLSLFADICIQNKNYDKAMALLNRIYKKSKTRRTLYQMVLASIKIMNIEDAERYLKEYEELAPNDYSIYIFRYKIDKAKKEPYYILIESLQKLKEYAYIEKWAYELAKLYYKAGMEKECIQECSDLILWFGEGSYVEKAKILKAYYSGEIDKDEIIEGLKNRALSGITADLDESIQSIDSQQEIAEEESSDAEHQAGDTKPIIQLQDTPEDMILYKVAETVGKEVDSLMNKDGEVTADSMSVYDSEPAYGSEPAYDSKTVDEKKADVSDSKPAYDLKSADEEETDIYDSKSVNEDKMDIYRFIRTDDKNEDLDRLDKLSESLGIDVYQIFGKWLHVKSIQKQLARSLELIMNKHTKSVQMIITGAPSSGKTTLARDIAVFLNRTEKLKTSKIAKISSIKLNRIDITNMKEELRNCCLVIENASELKKPTIDKLLELIRYFHGDIAVIFEENKKNMNRLFRECPKLMELFKNRIHLPSYTEEDLLGFAYAYIVQREYKIKPLVLDILKVGISEIIKNTDRDNRLESISNYVQSAMDSADLRTGKQLPKLAAEGRLAEADILSLLPEDFSYQATT
ncbi:MAG TPA: tetratricopeptide repeat protein [Clostridiales bacterium]|nr:tetratricopeptide repeat protein [Clostridiales bacterium]